VLTFPFPWWRRLAQDGALFGQLTRIFVETVQAFYACRAAREGALGAQTGTVTVTQRTSLHAATRAGAFDPAGREALLRYVLRPPIAQERLEQRPDGPMRIILK
jgi:hypothetical protein